MIGLAINLQRRLLISNLNVICKTSSHLNHKEASTKPLVVLLPWLGASKVGVTKYKKLYEDLGCDVVARQPLVADFLWPRTGLKNSTEYLEKIQGKVEGNRPIVIHAMSIGGYFYALMLMCFEADERFKNISGNIKCHVIDSPVVGTLREMATGVAMMVTKNSALKFMLINTTMLYFALSKPHTVDYYEKSMDVFKNRPPNVPTLTVSSDGDPMSLPHALDGWVEAWRGNGQDVTYHVWKHSEHAQHLRHHPEEYKKLVIATMKKAGL